MLADVMLGHQLFVLPHGPGPERFAEVGVEVYLQLCAPQRLRGKHRRHMQATMISNEASLLHEEASMTALAVLGVGSLLQCWCCSSCREERSGPPLADIM